MESNYYQRDLQDELSSVSSINAPYHSAKTVWIMIILQEKAEIEQNVIFYILPECTYGNNVFSNLEK